MSDLYEGRMRVRCERGHFVSNVVGHAKANPIGYHLTNVTGDCSRCGEGVEVFQTFDGEVVGWSWEDIFGDWEPGSTDAGGMDA